MSSRVQAAGDLVSSDSIGSGLNKIGRRKFGVRWLVLAAYVVALISTASSCVAKGVTPYASPEGWPAFSFDAPRGWTANQYDGSENNPARGVLFTGPINQGGTLYATMAVEFFEVSAAMAPYAEPKERLAQIQRSLKEPHERIQRFGSVIVGGRESMEVVYDAFSWPPHSYAPGDRVATTEWEVYIKDGDVVYGLAYGSAREDFDKHAPLFRRLLQTFRIQ